MAISLAIEKIVSIPCLAQSVMAIVLRRPNDARARPSSLLKKSEEYEKVFSIDYPVPVFLKCALALKRVDEVLRNANLDSKDHTNIRFYVALDVACTALGTANPTPGQIADLQISAITDALISDSLGRILKMYGELGATDQCAKGTEFVELLKTELGSRYPCLKLKR